MIKIGIAGLTIGLENRYTHIVNLTRDYVVDGECDFCVCATDGDIAAERELSEQQYGCGYLESIVLYRKIADKLADYDAFVFHSATLEGKDGAYAITARSGVGKTTHIKLWLSEFADEVRVLNGDKPIVRIIDGTPYVCGTPWRGKEGYGVNAVSPLRAIGFLKRAETNTATVITPTQALLDFMSQIYIPNDSASTSKIMSLADTVLRRVKLVRLGCNMDAEAAHVARRALCD